MRRSKHPYRRPIEWRRRNKDQGYSVVLPSVALRESLLQSREHEAYASRPDELRQNQEYVDSLESTVPRFWCGSETSA